MSVRRGRSPEARTESDLLGLGLSGPAAKKPSMLYTSFIQKPASGTGGAQPGGNGVANGNGRA